MELVKIMIGLLGALFLGYSFSLLEKALEIYRLKREFLRLPLGRIEGLKGQRIKIRGMVRPSRNSLKGPFSGKECVYCKYQIMRKKPGAPLIRVKNDRQDAPFYIDDDSGSIRVEPQSGRFIVRHTTILGDSLSPEGKENLRALLPRIGTYEGYQIIEEHLEPGEEVTAVGQFVQGKGENSVKSSPGLPLLVVRCSDEAFVVLYNRAFFRLLFMGICFMVSGAFDFFLLLKFL